MRPQQRSALYRPPGTLTWHVDLPGGDGQPRRVSLDTVNLDVAQRRLADHPRNRIPEAGPSSPGSPGGVAAYGPGMVAWALAEYMHRRRPDLAAGTLNAYENQAGHLVRLLGPIYVRELRRAAVDGYLAQRAREGVGAETRRKEMVLLRAALRLASKLGARTPEPEDVLLPQLRSAYVPRDRWLEYEEFQKVLQELSERRQLQLIVACYTGARRAELMRMRWEDIDWKRGTLLIRQSKPRNTLRYLPLPEALREELQQQRQERGPLLGSFNNLYRDIDRACERAGIRRFSLNDCRRTFGSWMVQQGVAVFTVSKLMGHSSPQMVQRVYGRLSEDSLRAAVDILPRKGRPRP